MKRLALLFLSIFLFSATLVKAQDINPDQINWPVTTGFGPPVSPFICSSVNLGAPYTDLTNSNYYICMDPSGTPAWVQITTGGTTWGSITGSINAQTDLQAEFATKQNLLGYTPAHSGANSDITAILGLTTPLLVSEGGTGTTSPHLIAGTNVTITGTWPNQTINSTASGGGCTNAVTFNNSGTGGTSGITFNCSVARTVSYNTLGASPLAGSTSLNTVGTITTGVWHGTILAPAFGGTGGDGTGYMYGNGTSAVSYSTTIPWANLVGHGAAGGDLSGTYPNPTVTGVNSGNVPINATVLATNGSGQLVLQSGTLPNNISGNAATATQLASIPTNCGTNGVFAYGIGANGNALCGKEVQVIANASACTVNSGGSYSACAVTVTWPHAWSDTSYGASCTGINPTSTSGEWQATVSGYQNKTTTTMQVIIVSQGTSFPQGYASLDCIGVHN